MANARQLAAAGAEFVKAEGGREILPQVQAILAAGIPFCGHLGMLPQHVLEEGGYHIKGRQEAEHQALIADALALAAAGAFAIVLELVTPPVARELSAQVSVPTIGIGSGADCDGQILVTHDLTGSFPWFTPRFVKPRANCAAEIKTAVSEWKDVGCRLPDCRLSGPCCRGPVGTWKAQRTATLKLFLSTGVDKGVTIPN